jgi:hypothetical protein
MFRGSLIAFATSTLMIVCCLAPVMAQGVTVGYTLHVDFVYPYCWLYNLQVTFNDQTGRVVGTGLSLDGSELIVPIRMETPTITFTVRAVGYASVGSYYFWPLRTVTPGYPGSDYFWRVSGVSTILVASSYSQNVGGDYWITIVMTKA